MTKNPFKTLHCLANQSNMGTHCLQTIVVSDSQDVLDCAGSVLDRPLLTSGAPVHPMASDHAVYSNRTNIKKMFLDWWLIAWSYATSSETAGRSTFLTTALAFRD